MGNGGIAMWTYEKKLQYPVKIKCPNPAIAKVIITQVGGPDGELAASMRYLSQRYSMPYKEAIGVLNDVGISLSKLHINYRNKYKGLEAAFHFRFRCTNLLFQLQLTLNPSECNYKNIHLIHPYRKMIFSPLFLKNRYNIYMPPFPLLV